MQILKKTDLNAYKKAVRLGQKKTIELIKEKGLMGRSGSSFLTGKKWEICYKAKGNEKYLICNADEGEPGTFKDKFILEHNPEVLIEGILVGAYAIGAKKAFIYLKGEYDYLEKTLSKVIKGVLRKIKLNIKIEIVMGAGSFVCGEETAILESLEGRRGQPRVKPPFPTKKGLFGKPTVINNVETLANVPLAILFNNWDPDLKLYSLSGNVTQPGVYELPLGVDLCKLIEMGRPKNKVKAVYFGCSGGCMPYGSIKLTPEHVFRKGCVLGSGTVIVVDEKQSLVDVAANIAKFYEFESCGKCTPCREGTMRILALLENISLGEATQKDLVLLKELAEVIKETSFCGLGQTSTQHLLTALDYFRNEFEIRVT